MNFFTAELFSRFNSENDELADKAQDDWEAAIDAYRIHVDRCLHQAATVIGPASARDAERLSSLCLHDAAIIQLPQPHELQVYRPGARREANDVMALSTASMIVQAASQATVLTYALAQDQAREAFPLSVPVEPPFSDRNVHWLYDEIDLEEDASRNPSFIHRILLSNGTELRIAFTSVSIDEATLCEMAAT
jgi:hypothetical protein